MIARPPSLRLALLFGALAMAAPAGAQQVERPADAILKDIDAAKPPRFDPARREDRAYIESYVADMEKANKRRSDLILELFRADAKNERLAKLLPERWLGMVGEPEQLAREIDEVVAATGDEKFKVEGRFMQARGAFMTSRDPEVILKAVEEFAAAAPKGDRRVGSLMYSACEQVTDMEKKVALEERILREFPDVADRVKAARRLREAVGKPFELEFTEAVTGKTIRMADLKGKVVVVDFWATWCGPCVAEMPTMKKLYSEYKDKGVEFIGVSLDEPEESGKGLTKLKEFVAENEIRWPQYYQGKGWDGDFSRSWGINSIPRLFVVGPDGNLFSTTARGSLETMIPELLAKASAEKSGG